MDEELFDDELVFEVEAQKGRARKQVASFTYILKWQDGTIEPIQYKLFEPNASDMEDMIAFLQPYMRRGKIKNTEEGGWAAFKVMMDLLQKIMDPDEYDDFRQLMSDEDTKPPDDKRYYMMTAILQKVMPADRPLGRSTGSARPVSPTGRILTGGASLTGLTPPPSPLTVP